MGFRRAPKNVALRDSITHSPSRSSLGLKGDSNGPKSLQMAVNDERAETVIDGLLTSFNLLLTGTDIDARELSHIHLQIVNSLVRADIQDRDENDGTEKHAFPREYWTVLNFINEVLLSLKGSKDPLYSTANMITKKEGIAQVTRSIRSSLAANRMFSSREIVEVKRKTERVLSQLLTLLIGYATCGADQQKREDFIFFAKAILEKTPIHDRHFALLLFTRGILAPPFVAARNTSQG
jgi:hypothetical protein